MKKTSTAAAPATTVENIQALRAIAALLVVFAHVDWFFPHPSFSSPAATSMGAMGVDIFFVISGFVISLTADKRHHKPAEFLLARVARVTPLYLTFTLIEIASHPGFYSWKSIWNGVLYFPLFDFGAYTFAPMHVGWTLSFEMWFYVAFALLLTRMPPVRVVQLLPLLFLAGAILGLFYRQTWNLPRFLTNPFVLEFALGCLVYRYRHLARGFVPWALLALAALGYCLSIPHGMAFKNVVDEIGGQPTLAWLRVGFWGLTAAFLVGGLVGLEQGAGIILPRFLVAMGTFSYSLYLVHVPVMTTLARIDSTSSLLAALQLPACILAGWLCYRFVEKPFTLRAQLWAKKASQWLYSRQPPVLASEVLEA